MVEVIGVLLSETFKISRLMTCDIVNSFCFTLLTWPKFERVTDLYINRFDKYNKRFVVNWFENKNNINSDQT